MGMRYPTIWKFPIEITDEQDVMVPGGAEFLRAAMQGEKLCLWALVDAGSPHEMRRIRVIGTGLPFEDSDKCKYIGTAHDHRGAVWHVFEKVRK